VKRLRRFCPYCGAIIRPERRACKAHRDLPALDPYTASKTRLVTDPLPVEEEPLRGLPTDLQIILRDQSIIVPQDQAVFEKIAEWASAPSDTASA